MKKKLAVLCFSIFSFSISFASENAEQILSSSALFGNAPNIVMELNMTIATSRGTKERGLQFYLSQTPGSEESKMLLQITSPGFLSRMKFLTLTNSSGQDQKWIRTSQGVRKIASGGGNEPIFDSDFTAEDLSGIQTDEYTLTLGADEEIDGKTCYNIIARSKSSSALYSRREFLIDKESRLLLSLRYYQGNDLIKEYIVEEITLEGSSYFPARGVMTNHQQNTSTILEIESIELPSSIPARRFNKGSL